MIRKILKSLAAAVVVGSTLVAVPANAGTAIAYYYDYPGGTPAGYRIYCTSGGLYDSWGEETGIFYIDYNYPTPC